jgi:penicillin-binding protein 1A
MNGFKPTSVVVDSPVCIGNWCPKNYGGGHAGAMTLTQAITRSINVIPVKLSIALGKGNPKIGRAMIRETARKAGIRTPLPDTPSMPIGADEVTVLDHTGGYTMFPNLGKAMAPHAVLEVRSGAGELIWRWDRDGKKPVQVITPQVAMDMNMMMSHVVEEGTARRAILDGIRSAGKTGTTNAYRDAWFVGFTGNMVCGIWFGNDDYTVMHQMTGGSLPAMTWHEIMAYAHQGIELKPIPGLGPQAPSARPVVAEGKKDGEAPPSRPASLLTKRGADALVRVERLMDDATRALATGSEPSKASDNTTPRPQGTVASASPQQPPGQPRGD